MSIGYDNYLARAAEDYFGEPTYEQWFDVIDSWTDRKYGYDITLATNRWHEPVATLTFDNGQTEEYDNLWELQERLEHMDEDGYDE